MTRFFMMFALGAWVATSAACSGSTTTPAGTLGRHDPSWVFGLDSDDRAPPSGHSSGVDPPSQSWPATLELGAGHSWRSSAQRAQRRVMASSACGGRVAATPILSGLHHEYRLEQKAAW